ncbi:MAG: hypothetical protein E3J41_04180 [Candidatus Cloacimonadota bacterium]|nr:MAG: hypothetical protein E3J41_04180 [Candidatus Cloacimonadota bacterium]
MKSILFLIIILLSGCSVKRNVFHDPHFFYDKENYTIIRVNPETRDEDIAEYIMWVSKDYKPKSGQRKKKPKPKKYIEPIYPTRAQKMGYEARITLLLKVNSTGVVEIARLLDYFANSRKLERKLDEIENLLVKSTLESAINTEFYLHYNEEGNPEYGYMYYTINFVLENN